MRYSGLQGGFRVDSRLRAPPCHLLGAPCDLVDRRRRSPRPYVSPGILSERACGFEGGRWWEMVG